MFFGNGLGDPMFDLMATHPPIPERIHAIDPAWDGKFPALKPEQVETVKRAALSGLKPSPLPDIMRNVGIVQAGTDAVEGRRTQPPVIRSQHALPNLGNPTPLHLKYAVELRDALPENLKVAAREPLAAVTLIYALLLSPDEETRAAQTTGLAQRVPADVAAKAAALFPDVATTASNARLPLVNLALGALRNLTLEQFTQFSQTLQWLVGSDGKVELFEFVLQKIIRHHLATKFGSARPPVVQFYTLKPLVPDCVLLLSALAHVGNAHEGEIQKAFSAGVPYLRAPAVAELNLLLAEQCGVDQIGVALDRLVVAAPIIKKNLLEACAYVVGADGVIQEAEAELLRAVADTLDCPMPPWVGVN
jgi:hypothetical protein